MIFGLYAFGFCCPLLLYMLSWFSAVMVGLSTLRHSAAHLLAAAVLRLYPDTQIGVGPDIADGFYYDFAFSQPITEGDLKKIEKEMKKIASEKSAFEREEISLADAKKLFAKQKYKLELLEDLDSISIYRTGDFVDLCAGPHVENTRELKFVKLLRIAAAYWRGDSSNDQLTRIYGTAFATKEELTAHLKMLQEAKKRDHKRIGKDMELYMIHEKIGKGLPVWLPKGEIIKNEVEKLAVEMERDAGYQRVSTPHLAKQELFEQSGHLPHYEDSMYPKMKMDDGTYFLKAMNCPLHHLVFGHTPKSYRDLPLRIAEYGTCYRNELSGSLSGLLRVRMLSMNDAHIYCTRDQIAQEVTSVLSMIKTYYKVFGLTEYSFRLSLWGPKNREKYIDEPENWEITQKILKEILVELDLPFVEVEDEAAFYGPKIDVQFKNVYGREETMSTVQLDFAAKKRFEMSYTDEQGNKNGEVFVIHRAPLSTHERFMAFLIEHYAGKFPVWLAPQQIVFMTVADRHEAFAAELAAKFTRQGLRVHVDSRSESIAKKVRDNHKLRIPYLVTIGDEEMQSGKLSVRRRDNSVENVKASLFLQQVVAERDSRSL